MFSDGDHTPNTDLKADRGPTAAAQPRAKRVLGRVSLPAMLLAGLLAAHVPTIRAAIETRLVIAPATASVPSGKIVEFTAWVCPVDSEGLPALGPDGVPGTSDDFCQQATVDWGVFGPIGTLSNAKGTSTVLTGAELAPGETTSGLVVAASAAGRTALATVDVFGPLAPFFCFAARGERVREVFEHTDIDGEKYEVLLECENGASGLVSIGSDPSGDFFEIIGNMQLGRHRKDTRELVAKPLFLPAILRKPFVEQEHKIRDVLDQDRTELHRFLLELSPKDLEER